MVGQPLSRLAAVLIAALVAAPTAVGEAPPADPGIVQYVPLVPTADGGRPVQPGEAAAVAPVRAPVPAPEAAPTPTTAQPARGGDPQTATSPPTPRATTPDATPTRTATPTPSPAAPRRTAAAPISTLRVAVDDGHVLLLVAALAGATALLVVAAARRRRPARANSD